MAGYQRLGNNRSFEELRKEKEARMRAQRNTRLELVAARKTARPMLRGFFSGYRKNRAGEVAGSVYGGLRGKAAANWAGRRQAAVTARAISAGEKIGENYRTGMNARNQARVNVQLAINKLIRKPVTQWNNADTNFYKSHRVRYQNAVNKVVRTGVNTTLGFNNQGRPIAPARGGLRGLARLREVGRGARSSLRNKLAAARMRGRLGLSLARGAANLGVTSAARGYGRFAGGLGKAAGYGYRAGHALGNYPRAAYITQRANTAGAVNEAMTKYSNALRRAANNPTRANVAALNRRAALLAQAAAP